MKEKTRQRKGHRTERGSSEKKREEWRELNEETEYLRKRKYFKNKERREGKKRKAEKKERREGKKRERQKRRREERERREKDRREGEK